MEKCKKIKDLQVHIVEQHNDAVPPIHRAIASRLLPFSCAGMVHLDSHPDLLLPVHMQADTVFKPAELYDSLSIENWILPLVYAKHFNHIVWVKPPWAHQIPVSQQRFLIGQCTQSGCLSCEQHHGCGNSLSQQSGSTKGPYDADTDGGRDGLQEKEPSPRSKMERQKGRSSSHNKASANNEYTHYKDRDKSKA
ncbi:UPF0489 protein C5orf22 homolog [Elysia marginata]|uniref:UPF0489 protein C5orf22 homolog n=1 Tax=Elysia marginata TaxID=1093978 RepID=A0AAV4JIN4_9GAST|nr:UPF0489 protein C5orf22 homolog [Elysia marginata]